MMDEAPQAIEPVALPSEHASTIQKPRWTEELVDQVVTLFKAGRSANQIIRQLGNGLTRSAVIGKLHRMGLTRARVPATLKQPEKAAVPGPSLAPTPSINGRSSIDPERRSVTGRIADSGTVMRMRKRAADRERGTVKPAATSPSTQPSPTELSDRIGITELTSRTCRWPLGDPGTAEFGYCGRNSIEGRPYCPDHHRASVQRPAGAGPAQG
ncbi:MAG: GcrA family cell cycle regulator [Bradyrhizobium sp.]|uniref:GcrA family cell cycle regulator n=1 Tax=Bradyrhizobium sp. TaxID=376 RepID=UPI003D0FD6A7